MLAFSPECFIVSGRIVQAPDQDRDNNMYSITNAGLLINIPLYQDGPELIGVLNCYDEADPSTRCGFHLERSASPAKYSLRSNLLGITSQRVLCRRINSDRRLRHIDSKVLLQCKSVPLIVNPVWKIPETRRVGFLNYDITLELDLDEESEFSLVTSKHSYHSLKHRQLRKSYYYIFSNKVWNQFGVKLQLDFMATGAYQSSLEFVDFRKGVREDDWTTTPVVTPAEEVEEKIGDDRQWVVRARTRYGVLQKEQEEVQSFILQISLERQTKFLLRNIMRDWRLGDRQLKLQLDRKQ